MTYTAYKQAYKSTCTYTHIPTWENNFTHACYVHMLTNKYTLTTICRWAHAPQRHTHTHRYLHAKHAHAHTHTPKTHTQAHARTHTHTRTCIWWLILFPFPYFSFILSIYLYFSIIWYAGNCSNSPFFVCFFYFIYLFIFSYNLKCMRVQGADVCKPMYVCVCVYTSYKLYIHNRRK